MSLPGHGETVGTAYIRILADGSGLRSDIEREWAKHRGEMEDMGKEDGEAYEDARAKEQQRLFKRHLQDEVKENQKANERRNSIFRNSLKQQIDDYRKMRGEQQKIDNDTMLRSLANQARQLRQQEKDFDEFDKLVRKRYDALSKLSTSFAAKDRDTVRRQFADLRRSINLGDPTGEAVLGFRRLRKETDTMIHDADHGFLIFDRRLSSGFRSSTDLERSLAGIDRRVRGLDIGKFFGKGSRNDFFNILGGLVGGMAEFTILAGFKAVGAVERLRASFHSAAKDGNLLSFGFGILRRGLLGAVSAAGALFAALNVLSLVAGPLAALLSMLSGVIVALASTIGLGLVGGVAAVLPLLAPLAAGVGAVALALSGLKADKKLKAQLLSDIKPITAAFKDLQKQVRGTLFSNLKSQAGDAAAYMRKYLVPVGAEIGKSISHVGDYFLHVIKGAPFQAFSKDMSKFIPQAVEKMGKIFTNVFGGMAQIIRAMLPTSNRFLDSLVKSSKAWMDMLSTDKEQSRLRKFFSDAYNSGRLLYGTLKDTAKVLRDLLEGGQSTGDDIFKSMNDSLEKFDRFLRSGRGQMSMASWFADSRKFLTSLGNFVGGVAHLFNALDTSQTRGMLNAIFNGLGRLFGFIGDLLPSIQHFQSELARLLAPILSLLEPIAKIMLGALANGVKILSTLVTPLANGLHALVDSLGPLKGVLAGLLGPIAAFVLAMKGLELIGLTSLTTTFAASTLGTRIGLWGLSLQGALGRVTSRITTARFGLSRAIGGIALALSASSLGGAAGGLNSLGGKLTDAAANILGGATAGSVFGPWGTAIGALGGGVKTVIDLFHSSGDAAKEASKKAIAAMAEEKVAANDLADSISDIGLEAAIQNNVLKGLRAPQLIPSTGGKKPTTQSLFDFGQNTLGLSPKLLNQAALGSADAINAFGNALQNAIKQGRVSEKAWQPLNDALSKIEGTGFAAEKTFEQTAVATGKLNFAFIPLNKEAKKFGTSLDPLTSAFAQRNRFAIEQQAKAIQNHAVSMSKDGASALVAAGQLLENERKLRSNAVAAGFNKGQVDQLTSAYQHIPLSIVTHLDKLGISASEIQMIVDKYGKIPKSLITRVTKKGVTPGEIQTLISKLLGIPKSRLIRVTADTSDALRRLNELHQVILSDSSFVVSGSGRHGMAAGGVLTGPTMLTPNIVAGEAGREAVVPLNRPLSQVDPSVRALSAFAQGLDGVRGMANGGILNGGKSINVASGAITVVTPTTNPAAVAEEMLARLVAKGY